MPTKHENKFLDAIEAIKPFVEATSKFPVPQTLSNTYILTSSAVLIKSYEYIYDLINTNEIEGSFFLTPHLRGICEDLITLKYLGKYEKDLRDKIIMTYMLLLTSESMKAQHDFFREENILQPVVIFEDIDTKITDLSNELKAIWVSQGSKGDKVFPKVKQMAVETNMISLYNYLYHATSRAVHFSPNALLRMGWGNDQEIHFSTKNFEIYYKTFNVYYGTYLFLKYVKEFKKILKLDKELIRLSEELKVEFKTLACPPIVTYEELNLEKPFSIVELLADKSKRFQGSL